jgi:NDP-sugar pyrophosphorylase family protein
MIITTRSKIIPDIDVLILCGGYGRRLQPMVPDRPKGMALIRGRPFLDILVEKLLNSGFKRIIFCVGHLKEQIINRFKLRNDAKFLFSEESFPLGTGGAVENALSLVCSDSILVLNGDSICDVNYNKFIQFHYAKNSSATFVLTNRQERDDGGNVIIDEKNRIQSFQEKKNDGKESNIFINAGVYLLELNNLRSSQLKPPFSLEYDLFPFLTRTKACYGFVIKSQLVDIGTPERYILANKKMEY